MNQYGQLALGHWTRWLPARMATIDDPEAFFTRLGEQAADEIHELADRIAGSDRPGESYLDKLGRLREARISAEEEILRQRVLLAPEPAPNPTPDHPDQRVHQEIAAVEPSEAGWTPLAEDLRDPTWQRDIVWDREKGRLDQIPPTTAGPPS